MSAVHRLVRSLLEEEEDAEMLAAKDALMSAVTYPSNAEVKQRVQARLGTDFVCDYATSGDDEHERYRRYNVVLRKVGRVSNGVRLAPVYSATDHDVVLGAVQETFRDIDTLFLVHIAPVYATDWPSFDIRCIVVLRVNRVFANPDSFTDPNWFMSISLPHHGGPEASNYKAFSKRRRRH